MSRDRFFDNPFEDYSSKAAEDLIEFKKIKSTCLVSTAVEEKWQITLEKLTKLDLSDYSVYTGTAGVALLKLKKDPNDKKNLEEALNYLPIHRLKLRRPSFLCGDTGPLAIGAEIYHKLGDEQESKELIEKLSSMQDDVFNIASELPDEYLYGRAGYLYAILYVNKKICPPPFDDIFIRKIIEMILLVGKNGAKAGKFKCPLMYQWHDSYYLGAAHGLSGIIYLLLEAKDYLTETEINKVIKPTIDYLATLRFPSGNFPSSLGRENDKYVQWCHGAPGFCFMYTKAYQELGTTKYLQLAMETSDVVWKRGLVRKGYSLCHGVSGNAYCFLQLFQATENEKYLYRAIKFAEWCVKYSKEHEEHSPDRPLSLFEGICGPMYLLLDIQNPMKAKFPGFQL